MDCRSVRWDNNTGLHGVDGNKKIKKIKRHVIVDKNGFLIAVMVCVAYIHHSKAGLLLLSLLREERINFRCILADAGYRGDFLDKTHRIYSYLIKVVNRDKEKQANKEFKPVSKPWMIEKTFAWFENNRWLCRNYQLLHESSENRCKEGQAQSVFRLILIIFSCEEALIH
ncbi:transposase [Elizabethkingia argenteiflava]|uniref:transposase n=1 Tax=Elizabethkingia argenteiflava TaxID=2681556 RepID=UPI001BB3AC7B|nr:transposase [Elizabethkingia argenteiflava]